MLLVASVAAYWVIPSITWRKVLLIAASYIFCGFVHPWFGAVLAFATLIVVGGVRLLQREPKRRKLFLGLGIAALLLPLILFKYSGFIATAIGQTTSLLFGGSLSAATLSFLLPIGISFYTLQGIGLLVDAYRDPKSARFAPLSIVSFMAFFPRLAAGPIERGHRLIPQIEARAGWQTSHLSHGSFLILAGLLKKLVVADNLAILVDRIFMLQHPNALLLLLGSVGFTLQILADFSGYTDMARGAARLFGIDLVKNFRSPYLAVSPSDFWRRWHISLSTWIRDYVYIPLGGSRVSSKLRFLLVMLATMGLSGLWHGAGWTFILWGLYHGLLLYGYHLIGRGGRWRPKGRPQTAVAWLLMAGFTVFGWFLFRAPSVSWISESLTNLTGGFAGDELLAAAGYAVRMAFFGLPLLGLPLLRRFFRNSLIMKAAYAAVAIVLIVLFAHGAGQDFIYFRF